MMSLGLHLMSLGIHIFKMFMYHNDYEKTLKLTYIQIQQIIYFIWRPTSALEYA